MLLRYFVLISAAAAVAIVVLSGFGLHIVLRDYVIQDAKDDAVHVSAALRL